MLNQLSNLISVAIYLLQNSPLATKDMELYNYIHNRLVEIQIKLMNHEI